MTRASGGLAVLMALALASIIGLRPAHSARAFAEEPPAAPPAPKADPALVGSTISAVITANGGRVPATGKQLWRALSQRRQVRATACSVLRGPAGFRHRQPARGHRAGNRRERPERRPRDFAEPQRPPVPRREHGEAVRRDDDPHVTSVEFISWNAHAAVRLRFHREHGRRRPAATADRGRRAVLLLPQEQGADPRRRAVDELDAPEQAADAGRGSAHHGGRGRHRSRRPRGCATASTAWPWSRRKRRRWTTRCDSGAIFRLNRETFRLMNASDAGRKAFVALLVAIVQPGQLDINERGWKAAVDPWRSDQSYLRFANDWLVLAKTTNLGILIDFAPLPRKVYRMGGTATADHPVTAARRVPHSQRGHELRTEGEPIITQNQRLFANEHGRTAPHRDLRSGPRERFSRHAERAQPSNPQAFVQPAPKATQKPSGMVNPVMLANTIGLTEGDRKFMAEALADAAKRLTKQKVTRRGAGEAGVRGAGVRRRARGRAAARPRRLQGPLRRRAQHRARRRSYKLADGFAPERGEYAREPKRDPKASKKSRPPWCPTSACLRCHDVRDGAKGAASFDPIPPLAFDPFDETGPRRLWLQTATAKRKQEVLCAPAGSPRHRRGHAAGGLARARRCSASSRPRRSTT